MRLYDFHCDACGADFEELVREVADARCPKCAASTVRKQLSAFNVGNGGEGAAPSSGGCAGGFCGTGSCGFG